MSKDTYYFPHDYTASNNPKISAMIGDYNAWGYGVYWHIIELLHQNEGHKLKMKKHIYSAIAKQMLTSAEQVLKFITDCIEEYELFYLEDGYFVADRVVKNVTKMKEISEKRSYAGKQSVIKRLANAEHVLTSVEQNSTKEKKRKEIHTNSIGNFVAPSLDEVKKYFEEKGYSEQTAITAFDFYSTADWVDSKGNKVKNWKQKMIAVWFKPEHIIQPKKTTANGSPLIIDHRKVTGKW